MVNVQKYQIVAIGDTVSECEESYTNLMYKNGIKTEAEDTRSVETLTAKITKIAQGVIDGDSHYYIMLEGSDEIFDVSVVDLLILSGLMSEMKSQLSIRRGSRWIQFFP